jgi:Tol biopolymer transport system component
MLTENRSFMEPESKTLSRLPQRNLPTLAAIIMAAWLPVAVCYAESSSGKTEKAASAATPIARGAYFGQKPPGKTPVLFAAGILSLPNRMEARIAFSPDGNECFFTVPNNFNFTNVQMYYTKRVKNVWTPQVLPPFSLPGHSYSQPFFSADGNKLFFTSAKTGSKKIGIWVVERTTHGWGTPQLLPSPINSDDETGEYSQTTDGTAYFESDRAGGLGMVDLWRASPQHPDQPLKVENLGPTINTATYDSDPFISPDGKYLIFSSNRDGGHGGADLYVTFVDGKGTWSVPVNLNQYIPGINTDAVEYGASLSLDGLYLFFVRLDPKAKKCDVYWVENPFSGPRMGLVQGNSQVKQEQDQEGNKDIV